MKEQEVQVVIAKQKIQVSDLKIRVSDMGDVLNRYYKLLSMVPPNLTDQDKFTVEWLVERGKLQTEAEDLLFPGE